jgi:dihydrofolate reductase
MRKLILSMAVSLDRLVARPGRHGAGGWGLPPDDPALKKRKLDWMLDIGLHLMGRNTYEEMAEFWPTSNDAHAAPMNNFEDAQACRVAGFGGSHVATWPKRSRR